MTAVRSYARGLRKASGEGRMVLLLWLFNILFASIVYLRFSGYFNALLETRAAGAGFLRAIDFNVVLEILTTDGAAPGRFISLALLVILAFGFFSIFLGGGILHTLWAGYAGREFDAVMGGGTSARPRRLAPLFFQGAGKNFGRFFRLFLSSLVLWAAALAVMMIVMAALRPLTRDTANESLMFWAILFQVVAALFLAFLVRMIVDYARIRMVTEDSASALRASLRAIGFIFRNIGRTLALTWLYVLTGTVLAVLFWIIDASIENTPFLAVLAAFFIGQVFVLSRGWLKVGLQAAQMELYRSASRTGIVPESPSAEPVPAAGRPTDEQ